MRILYSIILSNYYIVETLVDLALHALAIYQKNIAQLIVQDMKQIQSTKVLLSRNTEPVFATILYLPLFITVLRLQIHNINTSSSTIKSYSLYRQLTFFK